MKSRRTIAAVLAFLACLIGMGGFARAAWFKAQAARHASGSHRDGAAKSTPASHGIYWGAAIGPQLTGGEAPYSAAAIPAFENQVHKKLSIVSMGWPFANCNSANSDCTPFPFPYGGANRVRSDGAIPLISMQTAPSSGISDDDPVTLSSIVDGSWDGFLREYADEVKSWRHPFFLRLDWEMNGNWMPWSPGVDGSTAQEYVAAWRHIWNIFHESGATNVTWVWCPNVSYASQLAALYPGSQYVNWTCLDGYNNGAIPWEPDSTFESWNQLYRRSYDNLTQKIAPNKPVMVGEFATTSYGGNKPQWIANALSVVPSQYPDIRAIVYYDLWDTVDWTLNSSQAAVDAFARGIQNSDYLTNRFGHIGGSIRPAGS